MPLSGGLPSLASAGLRAARLGFVNHKSDVVWGERAASGWVPVSADGCPRVSDMSSLMWDDAELVAAGRKSAVRNC